LEKEKGMKKDWNERAKENAYMAILTTNDTDVFWNSGETAAEALYLIFGNTTYLDFGCGIGRIAIPLSKRTSGDVYAYDISGNMITKGRKIYKADNLLWVVGDEEGEKLKELPPINVIFERLVFQHIPTSYLTKYLTIMHSILSDTGLLLAKVAITINTNDRAYWKNIPDTDSWTSRMYTEEDLNSIMDSAGFTRYSINLRGEFSEGHTAWRKIDVS
jgi:SAM-dependent methyltransferase